MKPSDFPTEYEAQLNRKLVKTCKADTVNSTRDIAPPCKADIKAESALQKLCIAEMTRTGYRLMTAANHIEACNGLITGWYGHLSGKRAKGVSQLPDIYAYDLRMQYRPLMVELKIEPIHWQPGQEEMVELGAWQLATSFERFKAVKEEWERERHPVCDGNGSSEMP